MIKIKKFRRTKEDFVCDRCGFFVGGDGYTNHCPKCLWSKHVDVNPGDRMSECFGMMEPIDVFVKGDEYAILHKCIKCGYEKKNRTSKKDDFNSILKISSKKPL